MRTYPSLHRFWPWALATGLVLVGCASPGAGQNSGPTADAGPDRDVVVGEAVVLDGSASSDPDGEPLTYSWSVQVQPSGSSAAIADADAVQASFTPDAEGAYEVQLQVSDGRAEDIDTITLTAWPPGLEALPGEDDTPAAEAVFDLHVPLVLDESHVTQVDDGPSVLRTEIEIEFAERATVGDVNAVLAELGGAIVSMVRNTPVVVVELPDPGDLASLEARIQELEALPTIESVTMSLLMQVPELPRAEDASGIGTEELPPALATRARIDHHLAIRGHGAWNARGALPPVADRPWYLIGDFFGDGAPGDGFGVQAIAGDYGSGNAYRHGYHVLGISLGSYGGGATTNARSDVTGMFPGMLMVRAVDITQGLNTNARTRNRLVHRMNDIVDADPGARIVVNTSIGYAKPRSIFTSQNSDARKYIAQIRSNDLERRVLHVTTAGNVDGTPAAPVTWPAEDNSMFAYAALGDVHTKSGLPIENLRNVLVVENRVNTLETGMQRPVPTCGSGSTILGGQISAIGTRVFSFGRVTTALPDGDSQTTSLASGTSMATPQVAGLAALAWTLAPTLDAPDVARLLIDTARDDYSLATPGDADGWGCNAVAPAPVVDALDAILAAGGDVALAALLDVADGNGGPGSDGVFDEHDIELTLSTWAGITSPTLDYGRFDLNGDGITDGARTSTATDRMDLNGDGRFESVDLDLLGADVPFDENAVNDFDVLCRAAFGAAYGGSTLARNGLLGQPCGIVDVQLLDPNDGDVFAEGEVVGVQVEVGIGGTHEGDVVLYSNGREHSRFGGYSYLDSFVITTLSTREVCPGDPVVEVRFEDDATGLRASDTVTLDIVPNQLSVSIAGPNPRWVRVKIPAGGSAPAIDDIELLGRAYHPTCEDPFSQRVDQSGLEWADPASSTFLGSGEDLVLSQTYLSDGSGGFEPRDVRLTLIRSGTHVTDRVTLRPCSSTIGLDPGESAAEGYPECPLGGVIGDVIEGLLDAFGTLDPNDVEEIVAREIHGVPRYRDVLEILGWDPCDPRFCDPYPPDFPMSAAELAAGFYGDRSTVTSDLLDRLIKSVGAPTLDEAEAQVEMVLQDLAAETAISDADRALVTTAASVGLAAVEAFSPTSRGGLDTWRNFGFAGDPDTLADRADVRVPLTRSVEGFLTAVVVDNQRTAFDGAPYLHAAEYAAVLGAFDAAMQAPVE